MPGERIWHIDRIVVVIGWLDHCVEFDEDFDATILKTLEDHQTECDEKIYPFTPVQITNKLIDLSRSSTVPKYAPDYPRLQDVKMKGSQCFPGLKPDIREKANIATRKYAARRQKRQSQVDLVPKVPRHGDNGVEYDELANSRPDKASHRRSAGSCVSGHDQSSDPSSKDKNKVCDRLSPLSRMSLITSKRQRPMAAAPPSLPYESQIPEHITIASPFATFVDKLLLLRKSIALEQPSWTTRGRAPSKIEHHILVKCCKSTVRNGKRSYNP
jgi:hypothetical protein